MCEDIPRINSSKIRAHKLLNDREENTVNLIIRESKVYSLKKIMLLFKGGGYIFKQYVLAALR